MKRHFFVLTALFISSYTQAQKDSLAKTLDEVVVTANKYPNKTSLTGKVITVITREQIEKSGGKDLAQLLNEQSGVYINGASSNPGKDKSLFVRGAKIDYTLITIDGVPTYDASGIGSNFDIRLFSLDNIERIEILKGSQSTLYGSDAIAGVINIITRKATTKKIKSFGSLSYGSFNSTRVNGGFTGTAHKIDYNVNYSYFKTDGINETIDTIKNNPTTPDKDGYKQKNLYAAIGWKPNKNISIQPYLRYTSINGAIDQEAYIDELDYTFTLKNIQAGIKNKFTIGKSILNVLYNYNNIDRSFLDDSTKSRNGWSIYSLGKYKSNEHYAEAYLFVPINELLKLTAGLDYRQSNTDQSYKSVDMYGPYDTYMNKDTVKQHQLGAYAALNINTKGGLNIEAGGRFNNHSAYGNNISFNVNPSYLIKDQWKLYANFSSGYKTPSLYQLYSEYGNNALTPESALNIEGGLQYHTTNGKLSSRITYFNRSIKDIIAFYYNVNTDKYYYINQDKQNDNGVEIESEWHPSNKTTIKVFYTYVDGKVTTTTGAKDTSYFNLTARPRNSIGINISHQLSSNIFISMNCNLVGKRWINSYDSYYNVIPVLLKRYQLIDLYGEYTFKQNHLKAFLNLMNVTNGKFIETYGYNTMGLNVTAGFKISL